ncbi:MAG: hypothetical protein ACKVH8_07105 [Pirellulales bacterium]
MDTTKLSNLVAAMPGADLIVRIADYQNSTDDFISPSFELIDNGNEAALAWFDSDTDAASQFIPFAQSNDGGLFAYWKCELCTSIVYLASECDGSRAIAQSIAELLSIIALGSDDYGIDILHTDLDHDEEWEGPEVIPKSLTNFREWLNSKLGITQTKSPLSTIKEAMAASPDLMTWIREFQNRKYGA